MENRQEMFEIRIEAARDALKRSRLVFFVATVVSLAVLFAAWNAYLSWYRGAAMRDFSDNWVTRQVQQELLSEWVKSRTISVALLGIRVGISDAAPLASFSLLITSIWFFYSVRRSNHAIGSLLIDSKAEESAIQTMIYHGVVSQLVFLDVSGGDEPIRSLNPPPPDPSQNIPLIRGMVQFLVYLPTMTIFFIVVMDVLSIVYLKSPFRNPPHDPLLKQIETSEWIWLSVFEVLALLIGVSSAFLTARAFAYERGTASVLAEYSKIMKEKPQV